jgi:hypothetical protein
MTRSSSSRGVTPAACSPCRSANRQACLAGVVACVLNRQPGFPFQFRRKLKGQAALGHGPLVLGGVEGKAHVMFYCYSNNWEGVKEYSL